MCSDAWFLRLFSHIRPTHANSWVHTLHYSRNTRFLLVHSCTSYTYWIFFMSSTHFFIRFGAIFPELMGSLSMGASYTVCLRILALDGSDHVNIAQFYNHLLGILWGLFSCFYPCPLGIDILQASLLLWIVRGLHASMIIFPDRDVRWLAFSREFLPLNDWIHILGSCTIRSLSGLVLIFSPRLECWVVSSTHLNISGANFEK